MLHETQDPFSKGLARGVRGQVDPMAQCSRTQRVRRVRDHRTTETRALFLPETLHQGSRVPQGRWLGPIRLLQVRYNWRNLPQQR